MFSKPLAFGLLALACVTAAAGGAYVATRHNAASLPTAVSAAPATAPAPAPASAQPVAETEAPVAAEKPAAEAAAPTEDARASEPAKPAVIPVTPRHTPDRNRSARTTTTPTALPETRTTPVHDPATTTPETAAAATSTSASPPPVDFPKPAEPHPEPARVPQFEEVVLPVASVIGLQVETALSSERARIEDRVEARVTRDVVANGRVAIPAGSRVLGSVTLVDKGGKLKERARLGIRFHTLVLADGSDVALNTEPFYREGESPAGDSAKKIGGAAVGGAILGAILGGGKGAVIGGTTGAAGGTAAVMAGDRNPATVAPGSIVSVRLSSPVTIQVEKREQ